MMFWILLWLFILSSKGPYRRKSFVTFFLCLLFFPFLVLSDLLKMNK